MLGLLLLPGCCSCFYLGSRDLAAVQCSVLHSQLDEVSALPYSLVVKLPPGHCVSMMGASSALVFSVYLLLLKPLLLLTKMTHDRDME